MSNEGAGGALPEERGRLRRVWDRLKRLPGRLRPKAAPEAPAETADAFHGKVFPAELAYIRKRWEAVDSDHPKRAEVAGEDSEPVTTENQLVGLAFSGGGIRSATFNLGLLQVLHRRGVFKFVDYLSTVSGGGFLGCSLSALLSENARRGKEDQRGTFPYEFTSREDEPPAVSYLRNNSNYLAPRGLVDYLRIFAVLVRGIVLNFVVLLPFLLISSAIVTVVFGQDLLDRLREDDDQRQLGLLLDRNWTGIEANPELGDLLDALEAEAMIDTRRGMTVESVVQWLRGEATLEGESELGARPPLISGSGGKHEEYHFRPDVTRGQLVRRLWDSKTLRSLDALQEVYAVERAVRAAPGFRERMQVFDLFELMKGTGTEAKGGFSRLRGKAPTTVGLLGESPDPARFVAALADGGLLRDEEECFSYRLTCSFIPKLSLGKILQQLYERGVYEPRWIEGRVGQTAFAPPLAYWEYHELASVEAALRPALVASDVPAFVLTVGPLSPEEQDRATAVSRGELQTLEALVVVRLETRALDPKRVPRVFFPALHGPPWIFTVLPVDARLPAWATLRDLVRGLYERGLLAPQFVTDVSSPHILHYTTFHEQGLEEPESEDEAWDPYRPRLEWTLRLIGLGVLWILAFPLIMLLRRFFHHLRRRSKFAIGCLTALLLLPAAWLFVALWLWPVTGWLTLAGLIAFAWLVKRFQALRSAVWWRDFYERTFSLFLIAIAAAAFIEIQPYLIFHYRHLQAGRLWWTLGIAAASLLASMLAGPALAVFRKAGRTLVILAVGVLGPILPLLVYMHLVIFFIYAPGFRELAWDGYYNLDKPFFIWSFGVLAAIVHAMNLPIDVNSTSLHGFYRDRLSQAYLLRTGENDFIGPEDDLELSSICPNGSGAPYHLINAALNLQGSRDPRLRRRRGDFFFFSRFYIGGSRTGYCKTTEMERVFPHVPLSSAMAVSAAAASPNMGTFTFGPMVILMALLNIRLGYWIPNPHRVNRWSPAGRRWPGRAMMALGRFMASLAGSFRSRPGAYLLLKEMLSLMHDGSRLVNLSDGGHMENTGVFELLRRRCRYIIVGDAEADPELSFSGLAALIRYARIDLGVEIDIHVDDLRLDDTGQSRQHCALGTIRYPVRGPLPAEVGYLLYIKSSITGDESEIISEYRTRSAAFPHESTADQSFTEGQFEAYRDLGFHIAEELFEEFGEEVGSFNELCEWFDVLAIDLMPGSSGKVELADIKVELGRIERMLREDEYSDYFYEIYPDLREEDGVSAKRKAAEKPGSFRHVFHLVNLQLQLMESLFVSLELDQSANRDHPANRGWMNLFTRWAQAPSFRRAYLPSIAIYSAPFQQFCRVSLGLDMRLWWKAVTASNRKAWTAQAGDVGLDLLSRPAPKGVTQLLLQVEMEGIEPIPIGAAALKREQTVMRVEALQLRPGYQGAGIRARGLLELRRWVELKGRSFELDERALS